MRPIHLLSLLLVVAACNSSGKKDPSREMDDTARMRDPLPHPAETIKPVKVTTTDIPSSIKVKGTVQEVWKWNDNLGENLLILSLVPPYDDTEKGKDVEGQTAELHAFHYAKKEGDYKQIWMINDKERSCPFDITCAFVKDAVTVTDLDADGLAETKLQYLITCRSDVSPSTMKLILHEGENKYALRGLTWYGMGDAPFEVTEKNANLEKLPGYKPGDDDFLKTFGRYESEKEFTNAPPEFIVYARSQWMKFVKESLE